MGGRQFVSFLHLSAIPLTSWSSLRWLFEESTYPHGPEQLSDIGHLKSRACYEVVCECSFGIQELYK
jgi:hypothetical protein